ncbi:DUF2147 domain-containing protein [Campylobacter estrildidarum]|uniref:DUF2147 domain-containing protein n=1 Tax=Campylobacter estrildidarum TaxID=2510189 RepID=A0A4U7BJJ8_9BACT|nr:DUF2147 domain-containing protein [Campylobacter estrildidarum]TKX31759.1 hypothetical protein CQA69_01660 [Campylobacter estrildidarum]
MRNLLLCFIVSFTYANISGYYILEKDENNKQAVVEILEYNHKYYAYALGYSDKSFHKSENKNQIFMWGLEKVDEYNFDKGKILNIKNNKIYDIAAKEEGNSLKIKIKIKVLFGPTLKWYKILDEEFKKYNFIKPDRKLILENIKKDFNE